MAGGPKIEMVISWWGDVGGGSVCVCVRESNGTVELVLKLAEYNSCKIWCCV